MSLPIRDLTPAPAETLMAALSKFTNALAIRAPPGRPSWSTIFKTVLLLLVVVNVKSFPFTWHFRFYRALFLHLLQRRKAYPKPVHLFAPISTTSRSLFYECDFNLHKSNSTYFSDLDIARTHLVCHLIKRSLALRRKTRKPLYVVLAGVTALFRHEIKPFEKYEIVSRLLCWDRKWVWVVSHFVSLEKIPSKCGVGGVGKRKIFTSTLSKYVLKHGRITVPPEDVLRESGLLPQRPAGAKLLSPVSSESISPRDGELVDISSAISTVNGTESGDDLLIRDLDRSLAQAGEARDAEYWTWDRIEAERKRGYDVAKYMLGLDGLDLELRDGTEQGLELIGKWY